MQVAESFTKRVYGNFFIQSMDSTALKDWEDIFGILASPTDTLDFRRDRLMNRMSMKPPYTADFLRLQLDRLLGEGNYELIIDNANYTIYVESAAENQTYAVEAAYTINTIKPAHIVYINTPLITENVYANETISGEKYRWNYTLGSWLLGQDPFATGEGENIFKMASTKSLSNLLINDLASAAQTAIAKARINGSIVITDLTETVAGGVLTVTYSVLPSQTSVVNKVELLDSSNQVLSSADVYIPVPSTTAIKHTIVVEEAVNG